MVVILEGVVMSVDEVKRGNGKVVYRIKVWDGRDSVVTVFSGKDGLGEGEKYLARVRLYVDDFKRIRANEVERLSV